MPKIRKLPEEEKVKKSTRKKRVKKNEIEPSPIKLVDHFKQGDLLFGLRTEVRSVSFKALDSLNFSDFTAPDLNCPTVSVLVKEETSKFEDLSSVQKMHYRFLERWKSYLMGDGGKNINTVKNPVKGAAIRRACKLLIWKASQSQRIHFEIGDTDFKRACAKEDTGVTNSEIRAAFRQSINYGNNSHVIFYKKGIQTSPPWEDPDYKKYFDDYRTRIKNK